VEEGSVQLTSTVRWFVLEEETGIKLTKFEKVKSDSIYKTLGIFFKLVMAIE
jgi:hypothetical protein